MCMPVASIVQRPLLIYCNLSGKRDFCIIIQSKLNRCQLFGVAIKGSHGNHISLCMRCKRRLHTKFSFNVDDISIIQFFFLLMAGFYEQAISHSIIWKVANKLFLCCFNFINLILMRHTHKFIVTIIKKPSMKIKIGNQITHRVHRASCFRSTRLCHLLYQSKVIIQDIWWSQYMVIVMPINWLIATVICIFISYQCMRCIQ